MFRWQIRHGDCLWWQPPPNSFRRIQVPAHLVCLALISSVSAAQTNDEINAGLQFKFSPPGARSLAIGNAFTGLADDATAAYVNPAGLLALRRPEVSFEGRSSDYTTRYPDLGSATGRATDCSGIPFGRVEDCQDTIDGLQFARFSSRVNSPSFASYVHLFKRRDPATDTRKYAHRWRLALYRHELANFHAGIDRSAGAFIGRVEDGRGRRSRLAGVIGALDLDIENLGVAVAYAVSETVWIGWGLSYYSFEIDAETRRFRTIDPFTFGEPTDFSDSNEVDRHTQTGEDQDLAVNVGILWKSRRNRWSVGASFRQAPEFDFDYKFFWQAKAVAEGEDEPGVPPALSGTAKFSVPQFLSLGVMVRPLPMVRVMFEYNRVGYSSLEPESNILINALETSEGCPGICATDPDLMERFRIDDADELHLGFEYVIRTQPKLNLRLGAWLDPDHQLRFQVAPGEEDDQQFDRLAARFTPGDDEIHVTAGIGVVPLRERFQMDLAVDLSDRADILSASVVYRW